MVLYVRLLGFMCLNVCKSKYVCMPTCGCVGLDVHFFICLWEIKLDYSILIDHSHFRNGLAQGDVSFCGLHQAV